MNFPQIDDVDDKKLQLSKNIVSNTIHTSVKRTTFTAYSFFVKNWKFGTWQMCTNVFFSYFICVFFSFHEIKKIKIKKNPSTDVNF